MDRGTLGEVRDGSKTLWVVRDGLGNPLECPGQVGGPSGRSGTGRGYVGKYRDRSGDPRSGPGRVARLLGRSGTG